MDSQEVIAAAIATLSDRARDVRQRYAAYETSLIGREWSTSELMSGFVVDVGDLTRLVMATTGVRKVEDVASKLEHELADCLWSILVLAERLDVDLARAFDTTMKELTEFLDEQVSETS